MRSVSFSVPSWFPARDPQAQARVQLTDQESAVFLWLATGASNAELAATLQLSVSTVKFHVLNIRNKLGGVSRLQVCLLAALAREGGRPDDDVPDNDVHRDDVHGDDAPDDEARGDDVHGDLSDGGATAVPR
ncbi:helix-turn-helix transcriptional regulator [Streptomyces sp. NPDC002039]|uniref:helix-turn-helix domain-containing protein n=1 Tax=Streptomyces sp. NPDC002039 TaxID=3154660 RepID=UPI003322EF05